MDFSFLSGINNPQLQGGADMLGRLGNGLQAGAGSAQQKQNPGYKPQQPGLAGIQQSGQMLGGAPVKFGSVARPVAGGRMPVATGPNPAIPTAPAPAIPTGGYTPGGG
jgi:hypothetical protein